MDYGAQALAVAVLKQAVHDARNRSLPPAMREDARRFLAGGPELDYWCAGAGLSVRHGRERARLMES
jgi:hypothetical protein